MWGEEAIGQILHSDIQKWVAKLNKTHSASTVRRAHSIVSGVLERAVKDNLIPKNVAHDIALPKKGPKRKAYLSIEQVEALAEKRQGNYDLDLRLYGVAMG